MTVKKKKSEKGRENTDLERRVVRVKYLMEKYGHRWLRKYYFSKLKMVIGG